MQVESCGGPAKSCQHLNFCFPGQCCYKFELLILRNSAIYTNQIKGFAEKVQQILCKQDQFHSCFLSHNVRKNSNWLDNCQTSTIRKVEKI